MNSENKMYLESNHTVMLYQYLSLPNNVWRLIIFALFLIIIIIIIIITSPRLLSGDVLLFYVSFSLLLWFPNEVCETYCFCSVSYYYYYNVLLFLFHFFLLHQFCPARFSETVERIFLKLDKK